MADIASILRLDPVAVEYQGVRLLIRRPNLCDLVDAHEANALGALHSRAWALWRHAMTADGVPIFGSCEDATQCPSGLAAFLVPRIEALYSEGVD